MIAKILGFIQNEILGMRWLAVLTGNTLMALGVDVDSKFGGTIHFKQNS